MSRHIKTLINQLVQAAKARGISQAQLAELVGVTAVGLSKAKSRGDIRASTLEALATELDLELALVPRRSKEEATEAIKAGAFFRTGITPQSTCQKTISGNSTATCLSTAARMSVIGETTRPTPTTSAPSIPKVTK
jgi:transcriptional regulator with XRE-family HTH domain